MHMHVHVHECAHTHTSCYVGSDEKGLQSAAGKTEQDIMWKIK